MSGAFIAIVLAVVLAVMGRRWWRRHLLRRRLAALPGMQPRTAMPVSSFDEIGQEVARRRCPCGGRFDNKGESSRADADRRLRVVRIECRFCEERSRLYFDVTEMFH